MLCWAPCPRSFPVIASPCEAIHLAIRFVIVTNKSQKPHPAQTHKKRPSGPTTNPARTTSGATAQTTFGFRTTRTPTPNIRHNGRKIRPACGTAATNAANSSWVSKFSICAPKPPASRTYAVSQAGAVGSRTRTPVAPTRPAAEARALGNFPARHRATSRSIRTTIRDKRPQTSTNIAVSDRSRAATTAIAAFRLVRMMEKLFMPRSYTQ